jgi:hypothetical protein
MNHHVHMLHREIEDIQTLLEKGPFLSITAEERQSIHGMAMDLSRKLVSIESQFLTIGLLGGTGVGKSTVMNGLAHSPIASTSHRRPHTDDVLIYRHVEANPLPALSLTDVPWREITHHSNAIQNILLCDLPDFDSLMGEHREHVLGFLEHLDVLVWVTSPEKYADKRFYEFLAMVPKAKQNFYFVLNKLDLLFQDKTLETGYDQLERLARSFQEHIRKNDIDEPLIFGISAEEARNSDQLAPWNQFPAFRRQIFQQRDIKQVTAIKAANLDVEIKGLLRAFEKEVLNLQAFNQILEECVRELERQFPLWIQGGQETIDLWLGEHIGKDIIIHQSDPTRLVGPGYGLGVLLQEFQNRYGQGRIIPPQLSPFVPPEEITASFRRRLDWLEDRLNHRMLQENLPSSLRERSRDVIDGAKMSDELTETFSNTVALRISEQYLPSFLGFRTLQYLTYLLLLVFFLLAIGGESAWREVFDTPGTTSILHLILSIIHTLFSTKGLAALASYGLLNLFFAFRFYRGYRKRLRHRAQKVLDLLKADLVKVWEERLDAIVVGLNRFREEIQSQISAISALGKER